MYENYYGFAEKPFSLTPDPKYLYRSPSHANAFELLQYAIRRREGFVVVTGDIGTGKTTLCRALLEQIDRTTFTALVLNPFLSEEDLLKRILLDFGVISREDLKGGRLARVTKQELIDALYDFLLGLIPLNASAVLIIDEAQNLPLSVLEQIRILSNLETDKEKLLQIILVGQLNLHPLLRSPAMRQLDQRVSIRYQLEPLDEEGVAAYIAHRLTIAGGGGRVAFTPKAIERVHRVAEGIPRLINLICDRALLAGFSARTDRITPEMVSSAAQSLDIQSSMRKRFGRIRRHTSMLAGAAVVLLASAFAVGATALMYRHLDVGTLHASAPSRVVPVGATASAVPAANVDGSPAAVSGASAAVQVDRVLPAAAGLTILVGSYPASADGTSRDVQSMTDWLESIGFAVYYADVDLGAQGRWQRVLAGTYSDPDLARADADRLRRAAPALDARVVTADVASGRVDVGSNSEAPRSQAGAASDLVGRANIFP